MSISAAARALVALQLALAVLLVTAVGFPDHAAAAPRGFANRGLGGFANSAPPGFSGGSYGIYGKNARRTNGITTTKGSQPAKDGSPKSPRGNIHLHTYWGAQAIGGNSGGDADLRVRVGADPTITQTVRPGFGAGLGVWGGWNRGGPHLTGGGSPPSAAEHGAYMHVIRNSTPPSNQESQALRGEAQNIKARRRGAITTSSPAPGGPGFDSIRSIGPSAGGRGWDNIGVQGYGNSTTTPTTYQHIFKNMDRVQ